MKKKLFLALVISIFCLATLTMVAYAKDIDIKINDVNGNSIVLPTVDSEGDSLTWYRITEMPAEGTYFEYVDQSTTYYIVSVKTKDAAYVNDNYRVCYSYSGLKTGAWNSNIMVANIEGITHTDGKGPEYFNFVFEGTPICYAYIPASFLALQGTSGNSLKSLFYGCSNLVCVDIESGSKIETLYGNGFYNCKKLSYIRLPENLKTISAAAFVGINPTIVVPKSVTTFETSDWSNPTIQFTGTAEDHAEWTYQPTNISYVEHCEVYHNGQHSTETDDFNCTTALSCANCGKLLVQEQSSHSVVTSCTYANGFMSAGVLVSKCQNDGCAYIEQSKDLDALFICLGYSAPENGNCEIAVGFSLNAEAIEDYTKETGNALKYGVFVVAEKIGTNDVVDANGEMINGALGTDLSADANATFEIKISGFEGEQKDKLFAIGAFAIETDDEGTTISYMQEGIPNEGEKYEFISYNSIAK